jgi:ABC-2 type transport system ATP-binding protein
MATEIHFRSVTKRFPNGTLGLAEATWRVEEGARACLFGPPRSGKTTAIRVLQGALKPTGGSVLLLGVNVSKEPRRYRDIRKEVGILPQSPGMYSDRTAGEFLALACSLYSNRHEVVRPDEAEEMLDLAEYRDTKMSYLSMNYQRRLALAAALVARPRVLILDEPTAGLEPLAAQDLHKYLRLAMEGRTALLCTHNEAEAEALCDYVITLRGGYVVSEGTWEELRERSRPRLRLAAKEGVDRLVFELQKFGYRVEPEQSAVIVEVPNMRQTAPELLRKLLVESKLDIYECAPLRPSVESMIQGGS